MSQASQANQESSNTESSNTERSNDISSWIEEGYYYRGDSPPSSPGGEWSEDDWIEIPHENYIPIGQHRVVDVIESTLFEADQRDEFKLFVELLKRAYHLHYLRVFNDLRFDYEYFSPSLGAKTRAGVGIDELQRRERRFLLRFIHLMIRGNFNVLSEDDHQQARQRRYLLDLPVEANLDALDSEMIPALLRHSASPEGRREIAAQLGIDDLEAFLSLPDDFKQRALIFHRGIQPDQTEGYFVLQKLNYAVDRVFEWGITLIKGSVEALIPSSSQRQGDGGSRESTSAHLPRWLRRVSLETQKITPGLFVSKSRLQEPAFERVIFIFRAQPLLPARFLHRLPFVSQFVERIKAEREDPTIHVKLFQHIPLADLETIFPEKHVKMKSIDKLLLFLLGFVGLVVGIIQGMQSGAGGLKIVAGAFALLIFKTTLRFINTRRRYLLQMSRDLYHKNLDNELGVIQSLVDHVEDQEFKEALIAYVILLRAGEPLTQTEIDLRAERFIQEHFEGLEVDFEVHDALDKITSEPQRSSEERDSGELEQLKVYFPLIELVGSGDDGGEVLYRALPISQGIDIICQHLYQDQLTQIISQRGAP